MPGPYDRFVESRLAGQTAQRQHVNEGDDAQHDLGHGRTGQEPRPGDQCRNILLVPLDAYRENQRIEQNRRRDQGVCGHRGQGPVMPNPGSQHDLAVNQGQHHDRAAAKSMDIGLTDGCTQPVAAGQHAKGHHQAEERLAGTAMDGRQERGDLGDSRSSQNPLADHRDQGDDAERLDPAAGLEAEEPGHQADRRQAHGRTVESMRVLDPDAEGSIPEVIKEHVDPERCRPVRHCHPHAVGGHRPPDEEQGKGEDRGEQGHRVRAVAIRRADRRTRGIISGRHDRGFKAAGRE